MKVEKSASQQNNSPECLETSAANNEIFAIRTAFYIIPRKRIIVCRTTQVNEIYINTLRFIERISINTNVCELIKQRNKSIN